MAGHRHTYDVVVTWTGNRGPGTTTYAGYGRDHEVTAAAGLPGGPPVLLGSADPAFRGDPTRWNPEQLLVAALSQCHMLWYLHLAAASGVVVTAYEDRAHGVMVTDASGGGRFERVALRPVVTLAASNEGGDAADAREAGDAPRSPDAPPSPDVQARALLAHEEAHERCFVANSVNFPVVVDPQLRWD
ncbi:MAG: OsmC family protein [Austwickia sp.]|nr:MAG: OsmC family protein [Austwickia sp.]